MENKKIAIIGCGNLGLSIVKGLLNHKNIKPSNITTTKRNVDTIKYLKDTGVNITNNNLEAIKKSEIIIVALKPYNILEVLTDLKAAFDIDKHIVVSLATGVSINQIETIVGIDMPIFRAMPNTATDVSESITCLCSNTNDVKQTSEVKQIFDLIGSTIIINESLMDAATVLGACGIAYVLRFIRAMVQGGIQIGFDSKTASLIVNQVVKGASELLIERGNHPEYEIDKVTTPKGCTIKGLNEMEHNGFSSALIKGIVSSYEEINT
jgi:pyrroline-5-carboxylate reductase